MKKSSRWFLLILATLTMASLACNISIFGRSINQSGPAAGSGEEPSAQQAAGSVKKYDTNHPLPPDVQNFTVMDAASDSINFQTSMSLEAVVAFYRQTFANRGLTEREILTVITPGTAFSMVFDGDPSGKALVIQGTFLSADQTNVNIRFEDV